MQTKRLPRINTAVVVCMISMIFRSRPLFTSCSAQNCGISFATPEGKQYLERLLIVKDEGENKRVNNFAPSAYYEGQSTKLISTRSDFVMSPVHNKGLLCVDGGTEPVSNIELYDDGSHGDDYANDGIFTRDCIHFCVSKIDYSDYFGFAMNFKFTDPDFYLTVMKKELEGSVPYEEVSNDLTPDATVIATSHAFFFADTKGSYYPKFPASTEPNSVADPTGRSVVLTALFNLFGDVFDYATINSIESSDGAIEGAGIYKWHNWDRRGGPQPMDDIGMADKCLSAVAGIQIQRMVGAITSNVIDDWNGQLHEMIHGVSGYEYNNQLAKARSGDKMHVPGACTLDHSALQGPMWDWKKGYPTGILASDGDPHGVRLVANDDCSSCDDENLSSCCSFRYMDTPRSKNEIISNPELFTMSPLMLYIAGMIEIFDITAAADKTYYCMGSVTDGDGDVATGCGTNYEDQEPCTISVTDSDRSHVTSDYVSRFTLKELKDSVGGERFPKKKFNVVRHAAVHLSSRRPAEPEIVFYTLLWREHEVQKEPWERIPEPDGAARHAIVPWYFNTDGKSILHSRLHGIDCGIGGANIPSCSSEGGNDACENNSCGPGALCEVLDGQPLCLCREGYFGDGYECAFASETLYDALPSAYEVTDSCFGSQSTPWPNFIDENSLSPYPGGQEPYAATSCYSFGVCPSGYKCNKKKGCLPPKGGSLCKQQNDKGRCDAIGCCKWKRRGNKCVRKKSRRRRKKRKKSGTCKAPQDPGKATCDDPATCCFFSCDAIKLEFDESQWSQEGNCGCSCKTGIPTAFDGKQYPELFLVQDAYYSGCEVYGYDDPSGPLQIEGDNKNMFDRCKSSCNGDGAIFLKEARKKDGKLIKKNCQWLKKKSNEIKKKICTQETLSTQGYKAAKDVCHSICDAFFVESSSAAAATIQLSEEGFSATKKKKLHWSWSDY